MSKKNKTVLITGGAGFIGSHLTDRFLSRGHRVIVVDNLVTGSIDNLAAHRSNTRFRFVRHDISRPIRFAGNIGTVLHFASPASPPDYLKHPIKTLKVGSLGTHNALGIAKAHGARFLLASTSEVYGDPHCTPQKESYWGNVNPVGPRSVYDESKRFAEAITMAYRREHGVDTRIIRIFNTYGPRMRVEDGRVIPNFISQALTGRPLTVYGKGTQTRSYCYVDDLISGIERMLAGNVATPVNLGNPNEMSVAELARFILKLTGSKSRIVRRPLPADDPKQRCPDITLAKKALGWTPRVGLTEGLRRTIPYFRARLCGCR